MYTEIMQLWAINAVVPGPPVVDWSVKIGNTYLGFKCAVNGRNKDLPAIHLIANNVASDRSTGQGQPGKALML